MEFKHRINELKKFKSYIINLNSILNDKIRVLESDLFNTCDHEWVLDSSDMFDSTKICKKCGLFHNRYFYQNFNNYSKEEVINQNNQSIQNINEIKNYLNEENLI